jgi:hypothetical protein
MGFSDIRDINREILLKSDLVTIMNLHSTNQRLRLLIEELLPEILKANDVSSEDVVNFAILLLDNQNIRLLKLLLSINNNDINIIKKIANKLLVNNNIISLRTFINLYKRFEGEIYWSLTSEAYSHGNAFLRELFKLVPKTHDWEYLFELIYYTISEEFLEDEEIAKLVQPIVDIAIETKQFQVADYLSGMYLDDADK